MSKIKYEVFGMSGELSEFSSDGGDITFIFNDTTYGYFCISHRKYKISSGKATVPLKSIENGTHVPRVITDFGEIILPKLKKEDNLLSFPEDEGVIRELSLRLARQNSKILSLEKELSELSLYVKGTTCF